MQLIHHLIGRLYLIIRYKNWAKPEEIRDSEYAGSYSNCGLVVTLNIIAGSGAVIFTLIVLVMILANHSQVSYRGRKWT